MFGFLRRRKQAREIALSIGQIINMLSVGLETLGPKSPERLLRGLAMKLNEENTNGHRAVKALVPMTSEHAFCVSLLIAPQDQQTLMFEGYGDYVGFSLSCRLPYKYVIVDLQPSYLGRPTQDARLLYAECKSMPNAIEARDFQ